ncbi:YtxH domain-containing protein [Nonomuraea rhodomycinica]|uniref:YtxH domain-containing protein n=1 Tax=Nonomuraea rhodomycinica TaxID=1712872 RepID=A0A7Y6IL57_9ACTN|nr:YtxH domain-containing protein [Nonomuraea rhodomycinica]NUW40282.1 YtxH domain-containing protein [Nonomuraea rhodomycinica]
MRYRMTFAVGMAVGYVLGSRAGRERYEQIKKMAQRVADDPRVQEAAGVVGAQVSKVAGVARDRVGGTLQEKIPFLGGQDHDSGTGWPEDTAGQKKPDETGIPY